MSAESLDLKSNQSLNEAFPTVDPGVKPLGARVLIQLRRISKQSKGGIILVEETKDTAKWNNQVAKVVAVGPVAFRNRETAEVWPEGTWVQPGDFVRVPRWNGDRIEVKVQGSDDPVVFVIFNDHELIAKVTGDPLEQRIYVL